MAHINEFYRRLRLSLARTLGPVLAQLVEQRLAGSFLVGDVVLSPMPETFTRHLARLAPVVAEIPEEQRRREARSLVSSQLERLRATLLPAGSRTTTHYLPPNFALFSSAPTKESDRNTYPMPSAGHVIASLALSLYLAGILNENSSRWEYLINLSLVSNPWDEVAWRQKLWARADLADASLFHDLAAELLGDSFSLDTGILSTRLIGKRKFGKANLLDKIMRRTRTTDRDVTDALARYVHGLSRPLGARHDDPSGHLAACIREAARATARERIVEAPIPYHMINTHGIDVPRDYGPMSFALVSAEQLLAELEQFATLASTNRNHVTAAIVANLTRVIDSHAALSEDEKTSYRWHLEASDFYSRHRHDIEDLERYVPELGVLMLGKLAVTPGGRGGFTPGSSKGDHYFDSD